ncbi:hypothetical protein QOT17_002655 [Balamuthia mandrillaris]
MGYSTDFEGDLVIRPQLSQAFVAQFNKIAGARNNTYGDGDTDSFDAVRHGKVGGPLNSFFHGDSSVPSCWCGWYLENGQDVQGEALTFICTEADKFYGYAEWLGYIVDYIVEHHSDTELSFDGGLKWQGQSKRDTGRLHIRPASGPASSTKWEVVAEPRNILQRRIGFGRAQLHKNSIYGLFLEDKDTQRVVVRRREELVRLDDELESKLTWEHLEAISCRVPPRPHVEPDRTKKHRSNDQAPSTTRSALSLLDLACYAVSKILSGLPEERHPAILDSLPSTPSLGQRRGLNTKLGMMVGMEQARCECAAANGVLSPLIRTST